MSRYPDLRAIADSLRAESVAMTPPPAKVAHLPKINPSPTDMRNQRNARVRQWLILHGPASLYEIAKGCDTTVSSVRKSALVIAEVCGSRRAQKTCKPIALWKLKDGA